MIESVLVEPSEVVEVGEERTEFIIVGEAVEIIEVGVIGPPGRRGDKGEKGDQGEQGVSGDAYYVHTQIVAASTWLVNHNLGKFPSIFVRDSGGNSILGFDRNDPDSNNAILTFGVNSQPTAFSGTAYCN